MFKFAAPLAGAGAAYLMARKESPAGLLQRKSAVAAASSGPFGNPDHGWDYYVKCMMGGIIACGGTHTAIVPLDVVKCRMQTQGEVYKSLGQGLKLASSEGALALGWAPTLIGYSAQGFAKFGFYEIFKDLYASIVGKETAQEYRTMLYLSASATAEVIADAALCPFEAVKVRMQTSLPAANVPTAFGAAWKQIKGAEGWGGLYRGLVPLWGRQVPYTMVKFAAFERTVEAFYANIFTAPKETYSKTTQLGVTFASGYIAGVFCAVVSHPADTLVSKMNQDPNAGAAGIIKKIGFAGLWKGLGTRIIMVGTLTGLQWWIYDTFKVAVGLQASGGTPAKK